MKSVFLTSVLSVLLSNHTPTISIKRPDKLPEKCPSIVSLASQGLDHVVPFMLGNSWIGVKENSYYDTKDTWSFIVFANNNSKNSREAMQQLSKEISSFYPGSGPEWENDLGVAYCEYETNSDDVAVTFSPSLY